MGSGARTRFGGVLQTCVSAPRREKKNTRFCSETTRVYPILSISQKKKLGKNDTELSHSRWFAADRSRSNTRTRVTTRKPKVGQDYDDATCYDNSPMKGILRMCYLGYDYVVWGKTRLLCRLTTYNRVTRSLTKFDVLVLLLAQNAPLRWALSERAIIPLPRM